MLRIYSLCNRILFSINKVSILLLLSSYYLDFHIMIVFIYPFFFHANNQGSSHNVIQRIFFINEYFFFGMTVLGTSSKLPTYLCG